MFTLNGSGLLQQAVANAATLSGDLPPSNISPPELVGKAEVGATVSARPGVWAGLPAPRVQTTLFLSGVARRSPCLLGPGDDGKEIIITDAASNDAGEAVVSSSGGFVRHSVPHALGTPEGVSIDANDEAVVVDAAAFFVGTSGGRWAATCAAGMDALQLDIDDAGRLTLGAGTMTGSSVVSVSYSNSGGSASSKFTVSFREKKSVAGPEYDGSLGDLSIVSGVPVEIEAGFAFSGDNLAFSATGLPEGVAIDPETGRLAGHPAGSGSYSVTVIAANNAGSASDTFLITVLNSAPVTPMIGTLENRSYTVDSGARFYNIASTTTGTQPITFHMQPKVISIEIIDNEDGTYGRRALTAGYPEPTTETQWLLDGSPLDPDETADTIDAAGLSGDLTVEVTAENVHGTDTLESSAITLASAINPVHLGTSMSGSNGTSNYNATNPAYSIGDLVVVAFRMDRGTVAGMSITAPDGETVNTAQAQFDTGDTGAGDISLAVYWYIATSAETSGANINCVPGTYEQISISVSVFDAGTFNATTPLANAATNGGDSTTVGIPGTTATNAGGMVLAFAGAKVEPFSTAPSGWTELGKNDVGAIAGWAGRRDAFTTASESVSAASVSIAATNDWVAATLVIEGA